DEDGAPDRDVGERDGEVHPRARRPDRRERRAARGAVVSGRIMVMVPGYNEPPDHFDLLKKGRRGIAGLEAAGFTCVSFGARNDRLRDRIDRFATFLAEIEEQNPESRITLLGYSLGGLVVRGYLLAYPDR